MSRKLATIQQIEKISPIANADRLELCHIKGWQVISQKGLHQVGDFVTFFEIDSFFKEGVEPFHKDLEPRGSKKCELETGEIITGYLIRSIKLRGEISQGYIVPFSSYTQKQQEFFNKYLKEDYDLTSFLGVHKFEKPESGSEREERNRQNKPPKGKLNYYKWKLTRWLQKAFPKLFKINKFKTSFPDFIRKTDCVRIQNYKSEMYAHYLKDTPFQVTYKLDGSSVSVYKKDKTVGICSRNLNKNMKNITDTFVSNGSIIHNKLSGYPANYCVQGELVSPKIQGNFEGVSQEQIYVFSVWDIDKGGYLNPAEAFGFCATYDLAYVPVLHPRTTLKQLFPNVTDEDDLLKQLLSYADGPSGLKGKYREGLVYKALQDNYTSVKTISNKYLLKNQD